MSRTSLVAQTVKCLSTMQETQVRSLGWEDPLEKEMATLSSILAWRIPNPEEPGYSPWGRKESDTTEHCLVNYCLLSGPSLIGPSSFLLISSFYFIFK